ncbi:MAG: M12 family metallo-peptidase [Agriterribacter sp.]
MKRSPKYLLLCILFLLLSNIIFAQTNKFYTNYTSAISKREDDITRNIKTFRLVKQDISAIQSFRQLAGTSADINNKRISRIIVPLENDADVQFNISPVQTLSAETEAVFPEIQTYAGVSQDGSMNLRLTLSQLGMMGAVKARGDGAVHYFTVLDNKQPDVLISFNAADIVAPLPVTCGTSDIAALQLQDNIAGSTPSKRASGDCILRTYRFAVAATGEYTVWAGSQANAAAFITATVNNVNEMYENDFTIHLNLVLQMTNIYTNPGTDPFSSGTSPTSTNLIECNTTLNNNTGAANYDVGMLFGYGWSGGLANLYATCSGNKGKGAAGLNSGFPLGSSGPIFDGIIAHELGHQFSATHTMAANNGGCNGNVSGASAWEPGGGSTIMAYAGTCVGNAYQTNSDNYFHGGTIAQVTAFITTGSGNACAVKSASGNNAPAVLTGTAYSIPYGTPFVLTASGSDADANDILTYNWEQMDPAGGTGTSSSPASTATGGPLFRSFIPSISPERYFPGKAVLLGNASGTYEVVPTVARALNFKVTVRDNHNQAGCRAYEDVVVNVQSCGAFEITNLLAAASFTANGTNTMTLTWNPATACVTMPNIDILFSIDGGLTYPYTVLANTPNDGTQTFIVPNLPTCKGRFMIKSIGNIYYNINAADITITSSCTAKGTAIAPADDFTAPGAGDASLNLDETPAYGTAISLPVSGTITTSDPSGNLSFYDANTTSCSGPSNDNHYDIITFYPSVSGTYTFSRTSVFGLLMNIYADNYQPGSVCSNFLASSAERETGESSVALNEDVTVTLCAGLKYVLVVSSFDGSTPALPAGYAINITGAPAGGGIYTGLKDPGLNYSYVMVDNNTGNIVEIKNAADLTDHAKYLSNGDYSIYGISSSANATTLSARYAGSSFNELRIDVNEQADGLCAQLSSNSRRVMIGNTVLPADLLIFYATLLNDHKASVSWKTSFEHDIRTYIIERSIDGISFTAIGYIDPFNQNSSAEQDYAYIDETIPSNTGQVFYRLSIVDIDGTTTYSSIVALKLNKKWAARIYPNPVQHATLAVFVDALSADNTVLQVVDISGRVVLSKQARLNKGTNKILLPVQHLTNGMYLLRIKGQEENTVLNFVKR